jgi:hypothetical protein
MNQCPNCKSQNLISGKILSSFGSTFFSPAGQRFWSLGGGTRFTAEALACLDCGLVWSFTPVPELREFVRERCAHKPNGPTAEPSAQDQRRAGAPVLYRATNQCPNCNRQDLISGEIRSRRGAAFFSPAGQRFWPISLFGGTWLTAEAFACLDCGLVWSFTSAPGLREFVQKHCARKSNGPTA